jgi:hypothetical protein
LQFFVCAEVQNWKAIFCVVDATMYLLAREHQKAFFWIRSMAQSDRDRRTKKETGKERRQGKT